MIHQILKKIILLLPLLFFLHTYAGSEFDADSASVNFRTFDQKNIDSYKSDKNFVYEVAPLEDFSITSIIGYYLAKLLRSLFSSEQETSVYKILFYSLMIGSLILIVLNLLGIDLRKFFYRKAPPLPGYTVQDENVREMNVDELIAETMARGDWKLCIRFHYLKALRLLTDKNMINWQQGKTNMDYYYEIKPEIIRSEFLSVTELFENAWYGNAEVHEEDFGLSKASFEQFYKQIKTTSR